MRLTLIRHGKTAGNAGLRYIGRTDEPLSPGGVAQLKEAKADLAVKKVYVTSLRRTQQTADILFPDAEQIVVDGLREMDFGDFEGRSCAEMAEDPAYRAWVDGGCLTPCPNGESRDGFCDRVCAALEKILEEAEKRDESDLILVVHGGTIMAVMARYAVPRRDYYDYAVKNCAGYVCEAVRSGEGSLALECAASWK